MQVYSNNYPNAEAQTLLSYGISLFNDETMLMDYTLLAKLRWYKLINDMDGLKIESYAYLKNRPLQILKTVLTLNHHRFLDAIFWDNSSNWTANAFPKDTIRSLDQSALLWNQLHSDNLEDTKILDDLGSFATLRSDYLQALKKIIETKNYRPTL